MTDINTSIGVLRDSVAQFARERDWEQFHAPKNLTMAIAAEAAELMEHYLWCTPAESTAVTEKKKTEVGEELADVLILALQFANITGIDVATAITVKLKKNGEKYPIAKAKGRSTKYTEL